MERNLKEQIVKATNAVKRKVEIIKDAKSNNDMVLEKMFKPITDPLNQLADSKNEHETDVKEDKVFKSEIKHNEIDSYSSNDEYEENSSEEDLMDEETNSNFNKTMIDPSSKDTSINEESFQSLHSSPEKDLSLSWSMLAQAKSIDIPFGVRIERGKLKLGNTILHEQDHTLNVAGKTLEKTVGIMELLFKKIPNMNIITQEDLANYKMLLSETNAHRRGYDPNKPINSNKGFKYKSIIKPLFKYTRIPTTSTESVSVGNGIRLIKNLKKDTDVIYWNDANELVDRLKLLFASRDAGNTGLDNEIIAIMEELWEAGIIKSIKYKERR